MRMLAWRWWLALCCLVCAPAWADTVTTIRIKSAQMFDSPAQALAPGTANRTVSLPHVAPVDLFKAGGRRIAYRLAVDLVAPPDGTQGIFIEKLSLSGRASLNGHDLGGCGIGPLERMRCLHQPVLLSAGPTLWRAGENIIDIEVWGTTNQFNGLSSVVIGPLEDVYADHYRPRSLIQEELVRAMLWITITLAAISLIVAFGLKGERIYLYFGLAGLARSVAAINPLGLSQSLDPEVFGWIFMSARLVTAPLCILTVLAFFERRHPKVETALACYAIALPVLMLLGGNTIQWAMVLAIPLVAATVVGSVVIVRWTWQSRTPRDVMLLLTSAVLVAGGFHDLWRIRSEQAFTSIMLVSYAMGAMLVVMGGLIITRLVRGLRTSINMNTILGDQVARAEADLERKHRTILELERANTRVQERERFLRDLHDGLGSSLSAARIRLDDDRLSRQQVSQLLDECIDDMRLLLATSAPDGELSDALGDLRYRLDRRVPHTGLQMQWQIALEGMPAIVAPARLQLMRVLQEALANAMRHAQATQISVEAHWEPSHDALVLRVKDDGQGFSVTQPPEGGRGLANIRHRARQLSAQLAIDSSPRGTCVELRWQVTTAGIAPT